MNLNPEHLTDAELAEWRTKLGIPSDYEERDLADREQWVVGCKGTVLVPPDTTELQIAGNSNLWVSVEYVLCNGQIGLALYDSVGILSGEQTKFFDTIHDAYMELLEVMYDGLKFRNRPAPQPCPYGCGRQGIDCNH